MTESKAEEIMSKTMINVKELKELSLKSVADLRTEIKRYLNNTIEFVNSRLEAKKNPWTL